MHFWCSTRSHLTHITFFRPASIYIQLIFSYSSFTWQIMESTLDYTRHYPTTRRSPLGIISTRLTLVPTLTPSESFPLNQINTGVHQGFILAELPSQPDQHWCPRSGLPYSLRASIHSELPSQPDQHWCPRSGLPYSQSFPLNQINTGVHAQGFHTRSGLPYTQSFPLNQINTGVHAQGFHTRLGLPYTLSFPLNQINTGVHAKGFHTLRASMFYLIFLYNNLDDAACEPAAS